MLQTVRRVLAHEYPKYAAHLLALSMESRHLRFGYMIRDEAILTMVDAWQFNYKSHTLFAIENEALEFVAVAHIAREAQGMELAFSVLDQYQGQGMGNLLMDRSIQYCRVKGLLLGNMVCLPHNAAIRHLCKKHDIQLHTEDGETLALVHLPCADYTTFVNEYADRNLGVVDYWALRLTPRV
jgi:GNAT superfamily N-acetyltransferase